MFVSQRHAREIEWGRAPMKKILAICLMTLGAVWMVYNHLPGLVADMRTNDWVPAFDLKVEKAKCTVHWYILSTCEITYNDPRRPSAKAASVDQLVYGSWGNGRFLLLRSASHPEIVSTTLGVRDLNARIVTMVLWIVVMLAMGLAVVRALLFQNTTARVATAPLAPLPSSMAPMARPAVMGRTEFGRRSPRA
ncbi:MAG: hypothetical protein M9932_14850 [Xanthobacteraceae bacterium]|nr:hypothetical protein [Xanthobacteraceae bacterium]